MYVWCATLLRLVYHRRYILLFNICDDLIGNVHYSCTSIPNKQSTFSALPSRYFLPFIPSNSMTQLTYIFFTPNFFHESEQYHFHSAHPCASV